MEVMIVQSFKDLLNSLREKANVKAFVTVSSRANLLKSREAFCEWSNPCTSQPHKVWTQLNKNLTTKNTTMQAVNKQSLKDLAWTWIVERKKKAKFFLHEQPDKHSSLHRFAFLHGSQKEAYLY